ncbi:MAG: hypothetical protein H6492_00260 [Candidatus Paracaedibacteraceae bacterium]|nr:hypothetical protein [Candidatus Paracaedibacteraceae bacterium]
MKIAREDLKKLLLTASFVAVGVFLTGCGDSTSTPSENKELGDVKKAVEVKKRAQELRDAARQAHDATDDGSAAVLEAGADALDKQADAMLLTAQREALIDRISKNSNYLKNLVTKSVSQLKTATGYVWLSDVTPVNLESLKNLVAAQINFKDIVNGSYDGFVDAIALRTDIQSMFPAGVNDAQKKTYVKAILIKAMEIGLAEVGVDAGGAALSLSAGMRDLSSQQSFRQARTSSYGLIDGTPFSVNGVAGKSAQLGLPVFVQLKGSVDSAKATEATTGSVAYRLGNTVIGAMQSYANSGEGFGIDGRQLETSVIASQSFGNYFAEAQIGSVSAADVHHADWSGVRSQFTVGYDAAFVSPFVQLSHRQLNRDSVVSLNDTAAFVGLDADIAGLSADTYSLNTRLLAKVGYGTHDDWNAGSRYLGNAGSVRGSVEWSASLNLNSGVTFSTNLGLDTLAGSSAAFNVSLDR